MTAEMRQNSRYAFWTIVGLPHEHPTDTPEVDGGKEILNVGVENVLSAHVPFCICFDAPIYYKPMDRGLWLVHSLQGLVQLLLKNLYIG
jgi:hypothetical protein